MQTSYQPQEIPKKLHFIWIGGDIPDRLGKKKDFDPKANILAWKKNNPSYQTSVWYDPHFIKPNQLQSLEKWGKENNIKIENLNSELGELSYAASEAAGPHPDYGRASDLVRYFLLLKKGGFYIDIDVVPGTEALEKQQFIAPSHGVLFYEMPEVKLISNDFFAASPSSSFLQTLCDKVQKTANCLRSESDEYYTNYSLKLKFQTIDFTGPAFFRNTIINFMASEINDAALLHENSTISFKDKRYIISNKFLNSSKQTNSWLADEYSLPTKEYKAINEVCDDLLIKITHEISQKGILNIPYYLACVNKEYHFDICLLCEMLCERLANQTELLKQVKDFKQCENAFSHLICSRKENSEEYKDDYYKVNARFGFLIQPINTLLLELRKHCPQLEKFSDKFKDLSLDPIILKFYNSPQMKKRLVNLSYESAKLLCECLDFLDTLKLSPYLDKKLREELMVDRYLPQNILEVLKVMKQLDIEELRLTDEIFEQIYHDYRIERLYQHTETIFKLLKIIPCDNKQILFEKLYVCDDLNEKEKILTDNPALFKLLSNFIHRFPKLYGNNFKKIPNIYDSLKKYNLHEHMELWKNILTSDSYSMMRDVDDLLNAYQLLQQNELENHPHIRAFCLEHKNGYQFVQALITDYQYLKWAHVENDDRIWEVIKLNYYQLKSKLKSSSFFFLPNDHVNFAQKISDVCKLLKIHQIEITDQIYTGLLLNQKNLKGVLQAHHLLNEYSVGMHEAIYKDILTNPDKAYELSREFIYQQNNSLANKQSN